MELKHKRVHFGMLITQKPGMVLGIVLTITFFMFMVNMDPGIIGKEQYSEESEDAWLPENELAGTMEDLNNNYGSNVKYMQVLVRGKNNNVLTTDALIDILEIEKEISENEKVKNVLYPQQPNIISIPSMLARTMMNQSGMPLESITYDDMIIFMNSLSQENLIMILTFGAGDASFLLTTDFTTEGGEVKAKATLILVLLDSQKYDEISGDDNPVLDADLEIRNMIEGAEFSGVEYMGINEQEYVNYIIENETGLDSLFLLVIIIIVIILLLTYRSVLDTALSMMAIFFAIIWMNGIGIMMGLTFASLYSAVPIILIGIGVDYAIHMTMRYDEGRLKERKSIRGAMLIAIATVGTSLFLSAMTTGLSFSSMGVSEMRPMREFGIFLVLGILSVFVLVVTLIPSAKVIMDTVKIRREHKKHPHRSTPVLINDGGTDPEPATEPDKKGKNEKHRMAFLENGLSGIAGAASHRPIPIIVVAVVISLLCGMMALQLETEFDFKEFLPREHQITDDISYIFENFDFGVDEVNVLVRGDVTDPDVLTALNATQQNILNDKHINKNAPVVSILTVMQDVSTTGGDIPYNHDFAVMYHDADDDGDGIPDRNIETLYQQLLTDENAAPFVINVLYFNENSGKFEGTLVRVSVNSQGGDFNSVIYEEMNENIEPLEEINGIDVYATGGPIFTHYIINSIQVSGLQSLLITIIIAASILCTLFVFEYRSLALGLFTLVPVLCVIAWIYGMMYIGGIPLTVMTIMISTITVGIGIDYAIHITNRFMESVHDNRDVTAALQNTIINTGGALFGAAVTTIGGFGMLYFAPTDPMRMFGTFTAIAISFALISSIIVLPAFLGIYARRKLAKDPDYFEKHVQISVIREHVVAHIRDFENTSKNMEKHMIEAEHRFARKLVRSGKVKNDSEK